MSPVFTRRRVCWCLMALAAAFYLTQADSCLEFLQGLEAIDLVLSTSLAQGMGYREICLVGAPPQVREPPLFYLLLAGIIRAVGVRVVLFKIVVALSAALAMGVVFLLFQARASTPIAGAAALLSATATSVVAYAGWLRPDYTFMALFYAAAFFLEREWSGFPAKTRAGLGGGLFLAAAYLTRSIALTLAIGWIGAMFLHRPLTENLGRKTRRVLFILLPFFLAFVLWSSRNRLVAPEAGLTYSGRYLIDAPIGGALLTAEDFHAPLLPELPRISARGMLARVARQSVYYFQVAAESLTARSSEPAGLVKVLAALLVAASIAGWLRREWRERSPSGLMVPVYLLAIAAWPLQDPRLLLPLLPFGFFYLISFAVGVGRMIAAKAPRLHPHLFPAALAGVLLALNLVGDYRYFAWRKHRDFPVIRLSPGLCIRIASPGRLVSARLLLWARDHLPEHAVLMYHSPTPGWLVTGHEISSLPYLAPPEIIRNWLLQSRVDYILLDGWEREFPGGPAQFAPTSLEPALQRYPENFQPIFRLEGTAAVIWQVVRTDSD